MLNRFVASCLLLFTVAIGTGCTNSPESIQREVFRTGHDARVYNPMTGKYEWPDDPQPRRTRTTASVSRTSRDADRAAATGPDDGRVYNPVTRQFDPPR